MAAKQWVYMFEEGNAQMRNLLGGKGAGLAEMSNAGLPVPPGFTITTEACIAYYDSGEQFPDGMWEQTLAALKQTEKQAGKIFGDAENPLLVSVRSGARMSMPGMMDTVLNLGLNDDTAAGMIKLTDNPRFVYDAYRRFVQMFGKVVMDVDGDLFERVLDEYKDRHGPTASDTDLTTEELQEITARFKEIAREETGQTFPEDPYDQLHMAVGAVFESWNRKRAIDYRNFHNIPHDLGTAVNVVTMVYGNMGFDSGTGVAFTRDPATGEKVLFGEYLLNAQGEDVVAGIRTPHKIGELQNELSEAFGQFLDICNLLENHYRDVQDMEFTIERGKLWMLQTRTGKRTAQAAVKIAVDMVNEGLITKEEAIQRIDPLQMDQLLHRRIDPTAKVDVLAKGLNASPGAASGKAVFDADRAEELGKQGESVILVRIETNPDDVHGMLQAAGILTARGGATSHAAVVARGLGKPCVAGCESLKVDLDARQFTTNGRTVREGDIISINGSTGEVIMGEVSMIEPEMTDELRHLLSFADSIRRLGIWANADYPRDAQRARDFGAEGIGLCRTEHMFFEEERLPIVQRMILADNEDDRQLALDELLPMQRSDFEGIFRVMDGLPVIIRLIDPPLHEFLPSHDELLVRITELRARQELVQLSEEETAELAEKQGILKAVESMRESNPMLGLRGIRLGITMPGIIKMQVRAIFEAACRVAADGVDVHPEVMIPLTGHVNEIKVTQVELEKVAKQVMAEAGREVDYKFGTMIEIPRAALTAGAIAEYAQFFSFGTNDLTQTCFGYSRDDAEGKFLLKYVEDGILPANPFQTLDTIGVGRLINICVQEGRAVRPDLEVGICGEHGGDPASIAFCHGAGLNYVSCSPFRVPIARLAAAQAALGEAARDR